MIALVAIDNRILGRFPGAWPPLSWQLVRVLTASLCLLPALFAVGLLISLTLKAYIDRAHRLYCFDLLGGGAGCLLALPLMNLVGGDHGVFLIGALAAAGALLLARATGRRRLALASAAAMLLLCAGPWINRDYAVVDIRSHTTTTANTSWVENDVELHRDWSSLSRISIHPVKEARHWLYVRIDSSCQTSIPSVSEDALEKFKLLQDFHRLPYVLDRHRRYLEIGAGGGAGMVIAHVNGAEEITGVEINPRITAASLDGFQGYGIADLLARHGHALVNAEGRSFVAASDQLYDTITITFIQTGVADASSGFALTEANLFTVEAFEEYLRHLDTDGLFYVYRHGGTEMLRLISVARAALARFGITDPRNHLYSVRDDTNNAVLLVSTAPFTADEVGRLDAACDELDLGVLYTPSDRLSNRAPNPFLDEVQAMRDAGGLDLSAIARVYKKHLNDSSLVPLEHLYITHEDPEAFVASYPVDIRATTDDRPYFFFSSLHRLEDLPLYFQRGGVELLGAIVMLLFWMLVGFTVLVFLLIFLPLLLRRGGAATRRGRVPLMLYFSGLGLAYVACEISFIQRFVLFLGHPVHATSVVLLGFLVSSGLGSLASQRMFGWKLFGFGPAVTGVCGLLLVYNILLPRVFHSDLIGLPVPLKILISLALLFPLAFLMGTLFPQGLRVTEKLDPDAVPWAWGCNSATSVLGTIIALILAMHLGFSAVALATAAVYALCFPAITLARRHATTPA